MKNLDGNQNLKEQFNVYDRSESDKIEMTHLLERASEDSGSLFSGELFFDKLKWMTSKEAAIYIRVSVGQLRNMVWRRQVHSYRLKGRLRFLRSDLDRIVEPST